MLECLARPFLLVALGLLSARPAPPPAAQDADPAAVADFRAQFKKLKTREDRIEAVLTLKGNEAPEVVDALAPVLSDADAEIVRAAVEVLAGFRTEPPITALGRAFETSSSSVVRAGLLQAASLAR